MMSSPGVRMRAQNTAMGKILLSAMPDSEAAQRFDPAAVLTPHSARCVEDFLVDLSRTRQRCYAVEEQENELGISCVAIGITDGIGPTTAAISVSAPSVYMPASGPRRWSEILRDAQPAISRLLPAGFESRWAATTIS